VVSEAVLSSNARRCDCEIEAVANSNNADELQRAAFERLRSAVRKPYGVPIGGSNALGALGYRRAGLDLAEQMSGAGEDLPPWSSHPAAPACRCAGISGT